MDDGTCVQGGCTDSRFEVFDPSATYDDGSCPPALFGCMQSAASNYRALATLEDDSCLYQGCTDSNALNHDPSATLSGECTGVVSGCIDSVALNFYKEANTDGGGCFYGGCTDSVRSNYDPTANIENGLCEPLYLGCTNSLANNYNALYNQDDGSCHIGGCKNSTNTNYNADATYDVPCLCTDTCTANRRRELASTDDCMDPAAVNYNANTERDGECRYGKSGCTDSTASNYLPLASVDDGDCKIHIFGCTDPNAVRKHTARPYGSRGRRSMHAGCTLCVQVIFDSAATALADGAFERGCFNKKEGCTDSTSKSYIEAVSNRASLFTTGYWHHMSRPQKMMHVYTVGQHRRWQLQIRCLRLHGQGRNQLRLRRNREPRWELHRKRAGVPGLCRQELRVGRQRRRREHMYLLEVRLHGTRGEQLR